MAINFYDIAYGFGVGISAPVWIVQSKTRTKVLKAFSERMGHVAPRIGESKAVMIHAVSVGELNATRGLVDALKAHDSSLHIVISTTTETGLERAKQLWGEHPDQFTIIRYPLDFSGAVKRVLDTLRPSLVILMELEVWPNFMNACTARNIPVAIANGRITETSFKGYRVGTWLTRGVFSQLAAVCAQEQTYADRFVQLGVTPEKTTVTGTMKFDTAPESAHIEGSEDLARDMNLRSPLWVCGSTGPGEEEIVLQTYKSLLQEKADLQLAIIPRKPERFDEVAELIEKQEFNVHRRSKPETGTSSDPSRTTVILGDTMGELRKFYALADVVFVGRTLLDLGEKQHGSDMIEPTALGKPTIVGPYTGNFAEVMNALRADQAIVEASSAAELRAAVLTLLNDPQGIGDRSRAVVERQRGATQRTLDYILPLLTAKPEEPPKELPAAE